MDPHAFDHMPFGLCLLGADYRPGTCLHANDAFLALVDAQTVDEIRNKSFPEIWPHGDAASVMTDLMTGVVPSMRVFPATVGKDAVVLTARFTREHFKGQACIGLWMSSAPDDGVAPDGTSSLSPSKSSNFLATISHEIRAPMQTVFGLLEMMELERSPYESAAMARTAKDAAASLLELLDDVLDFARMDADQMALDRFEVPLRTLVRGVVEAMGVRAVGKNLTLKEEIGAEVPLVVSGDPKRLRQILINLTANAIKFTREGSVTIRVTARQIAGDSDRSIALLFEIIDTGTGLTREDAESLFAPYIQGGGASRAFGGAGLGLSICKKLVGMMDGAMGVDTTLGKGSCFWFQIPVAEISLDGPGDPARLPILDGISVLSVEDHPLGAREIVKALKSMGATVESCATIAEAMDCLRLRSFDIGLIDQGLPDGSGIDLIREIMKLRPFMALAMYTARSDVGLMQSLQSLGVAYIAKPASRAGLGKAVRDVALSVTRPKISVQSGRIPRLLIAEDMPSVRDVMARQLSVLGMEADFAATGKEALDLVRSRHYTLVMTDIHMPDMNGYDFAKEICRVARADTEKPTIVAFTADLMLLEGRAYLNHGFDECLLKPVSLNQMRRFLIRHGFLDDMSPAAGDFDLIDAPLSPDSSISPGSAIDRQAVMQQLGVFDAQTIEMLKLFIDMTEPTLAIMKSAEDTDDYDRLERFAHSLKGAARSACLNTLGDRADILQQNAEMRRDCHDIVQDVAEEFARAKAEIANL